ncbi:hypothetical protein FRC19_007604 [Serendipita sp. 401]|nr:hypothetical protein FRC19_007604 [Serendipita sp. 401]KAG9020543.1 hypothetical protein FS842_007214 [Serendipita sp. 407]
MLATKCLHMLIFPDSILYALQNVIFVNSNFNAEPDLKREIEISDTYLVEAVVEAIQHFCPRQWPMRIKQEHCGFSDVDTPLPEPGSLDRPYIDLSDRMSGRTFMAGPELNKKLHLALIRYLGGALSRKFCPWKVEDWEWRWSWYNAVIDLLQTVGPDVDFEGRSTLLSLYAEIGHKDILPHLPTDKKEQLSKQLVAINRYLLHDMCHALKTIKIMKEAKKGNMDEDTEAQGDPRQGKQSAEKYDKMSIEAAGIIFCLRNVPDDVRLISICIEENIIDHVLAANARTSEWARSLAPDAAFEVIKSASTQLQEFDPIGQELIMEYILDTSRLGALFGVFDWNWRYDLHKVLLSLCQQYVSSHPTVDTNAIVQKFETALLDFATSRGNSEITMDHKKFIDKLKRIILQ